MAVVAIRRWFIFAFLMVIGALGGCASAPVAVRERVPVRVDDPRADGHVIRMDGHGMAYINLAKRDRVMAGTTFLCFDPRVEDGLTRLEGTLTVMEVGEDFSLCRLTSVVNRRTVHEGDMIFNPVFHVDRTRPRHFVVGGEFDLDGDGASTAAERERVETMIRAWGGVIDRAIRAETDYLVMGTRPADSGLHDPEPVVVREDAIDHRTLEQKAYDAMVVRARELAIPVYNLNRVLRLIGADEPAVASR